ncbi:MAG: hypothetical protein KC468_01450 [Myxococcales bacterium]|nr:hypothetical protein [Myxococcales bacterium]
MAFVGNRVLSPALGIMAVCFCWGCATGTETDTATQASMTTPSGSSSGTSDATTTDDPSSTGGEMTSDPSAGGTPGISVTPPGSLVVRELGAPATISVVLDSPPSGAVEIAVASSDEEEGAVEPATLTFTADDWDQPQDVTVTGVDDGEPDGAQLFTVELGPVTSDDDGYAALDPDDLEFESLDLYDHVMDPTLEETPTGAGWTCEIVSDAGVLVLRTLANGEARFEVRIGAGGTITSVRDVPPDDMTPPVELLGTGPITERVMQWEMSSSSVKYDHPDLIASDDGYRVDQAGNVDGVFAPTVAVDLDFGGCTIDVFSVPQAQWHPELDPFIDNKLSVRTRFRMIGNGRLFIRRTMLVDRVVLDGDTVSFDNFSVDSLNFIDTAPFAHLAYSVSDLGTAVQFKKVGEIPTENDQAVATTSGYIALLNVNEPMAPAVGVLFGKKEVCGASLGECEFAGSHQLSLREFIGEYVRVIPSLRLQNVAEGSTIDASAVLFMQPATSTAFGVNINEWSDSIDQPVVIPPDGVVWPDEFQALADRLRDNLSQSGTPTDLLADVAGL